MDVIISESLHIIAAREDHVSHRHPEDAVISEARKAVEQREGL